MGYTDADKLAVNTIRLLSVSSLSHALIPLMLPLHGHPEPAQSLLSHLPASNFVPQNAKQA
jgi:hypothetical protein